MVGETVAHYRILNRLGGGGMGVIYEAEDTRLHRLVALKFIPENLIDDQKSVERFELEARAASQLAHPNICTIHSIEDNHGHPFIVMEKLEGESLKQRLHEKRLDLDEILDFGAQIASALEASHAKGVIHRDIKPGNIFITRDGQVKVLDFGLAKLTRNHPLATEDESVDNSLTAIGVVPGTAVYMSPEQARNEELDVRSDLFSFGVVLYEMATGKKPFHGANVVTTLEAVLNAKPESPLAANPNLPPELVAIIGKAMEKDRRKRYQSAAEIKADLQQLKKETESGVTRARVSPSVQLRLVTNTFQGGDRWVVYVLLGVTAVLLTVLIPVGIWWLHNRSGRGPATLNTIAVLPLQNLDQDPASDYLRFALSDEIANSLTYARSLEIRPTSVTAKYAGNDVDPRKVGHDLHVAIVMTGHFVRRGNQLIITLEAIDVAQDKLLWQTTVQSPSANLIQMQAQLGGQVRQGLLPVLGASGSLQNTATNPVNPQAYDLYLRSVPVPHDPGPNKEAIKMLERVVQMDPSYAPGWEALGLRYYYDATYGTGGDKVFQRSNEAYEKALALDPNRLLAAGQSITNHVERGELSRAYQAARALVQRRPDSSQAHFALAYVLRYAGMLYEAAQECDTALTLDPGNYQFRSCAWTFIQLNQTQRAKVFVQLDAGSEWAAYIMPSILLREGKLAQTAEVVKHMSDNPRYHKDLLEACLHPATQAGLDRVARKMEPAILADPDPEPWYNQGAILAYFGENDIAVHLIRTAIGQNYCAATALETDPLLAKLRTTPGFAKLVSAAQDCQQSLQTPPGP